MFLLRWRLRSNLRVLPRMFASPAVKKHVPRRHFGEHKSGTSDGMSQANKEATASSTVLHHLTNHLFYTISEGQEELPVNKFINTLNENGLLATDPRLKDCMDMLHHTVQESMMGASMNLEIFQRCVQSNIVLLTQVMCKKLVIPDFEKFTLQIKRLYETTRGIKEGEVANYIPQLAKMSPDHWGVSLCTVDGQRYSLGDTDVPLCLQSCVKPLKYAIAVNDLGTDYVHQFVGKEPSGLRFNKLSLNHQEKPHNPMVNAGAIVSCSLIKQEANKAEKFDYVMQFLKRMSGNEFIGFSNATFQSEKETGDRNYAIGYYLKEKKCFPGGTDMASALDLYFQLCSIEVTCQSGSVIAATLANGGICPITGERVLSAEAVRNTLSLMHSCGMYDFSGQFAFHVGLPGKSGVSGAILLIVPNIMGVFCWSPPLDRIGNSVRGIHFCHELVSLFNFHHYDNLRHCVKKVDPRKEIRETQHKTVVNLLFAAYSGDVSALRRFALSGMNMEQKDYDSRTALHIAAAEGHLDVVKFLIEGCKVNPFGEDRWGNVPLQDAISFERHDIVKLLSEYQETYVKRQMGAESSEDPISLENLESMV
ncbi:glutaminase liver isoform, mitochondrial [Bufo gargarizans]|uniref:glutaminase liver isoform, mitochondrial n=1 Tax=Bufo gargarizans TaxID=30331 RepID=UPI001CF5B46B|nr:glutaminase liver isoform, mitochondrial [Bufo gargarizans]